MKKSLIFKILYLFLILIVVAGASVFATNTYLASNVSYGSTNVENALNDLYALRGSYSTEEKVIGKWIDGKPIYRKVMNLKSPASSGTAATYDIPSDFEKIINFSGYIYCSSYSAYFPLVYARSGVSQYFTYSINTNTKQLVVYVVSNDSVYFNQDMTVILEYTKE